jgi:hypothetical protein
MSPILKAVCGAAVLTMACATSPQPMQSGKGVPASEGTVKASQAENGNTALDVQVKHLAPASKLAGDATVYVVWLQPLNARPQNVGALTLNHDLEGRLETLTPHRKFKLTVTPEPSGQVAVPTHDAVFTAEVDRQER